MSIPEKNNSRPFPGHIAIIMDGNRRWAKLHGKSAIEGHRAGAIALENAVRYMGTCHVPCLTVYAFSTENWRRARTEIQGIFLLVEEVLNKKLNELHKNDIRLRHLGRLDELPSNVRKVITHAVEMTQYNHMTLNFALNYGGRREIVDAARRFVLESADPAKIDEASFAKYLYLNDLPDVDLVIRTGGENRLSNFMTWQTVYSELYFTDVLWPDFDAGEIDKALEFYAFRQRRFGGG